MLPLSPPTGAPGGGGADAARARRARRDERGRGGQAHERGGHPHGSAVRARGRSQSCYSVSGYCLADTATVTFWLYNVGCTRFVLQVYLNVFSVFSCAFEHFQSAAAL